MDTKIILSESLNEYAKNIRLIFRDAMEFHITHEKTYRFELFNAHSTSCKVLYALHGYGQLAKYFIRKFQKLPNDIMIVAPEGMHRFYLQGHDGRVGASWMTKEDRERDIEDTLSYLNKVDSIISARYPIESRYLLGFSQGGATAARWDALGACSFDALILWASKFPPDVSITPMHSPRKKNFFVLGDQDVFFTPEDEEKMIALYQKLHFQITRFKGKHDIHQASLVEILKQIEAI